MILCDEDGYPYDVIVVDGSDLSGLLDEQSQKIDDLTEEIDTLSQCQADILTALQEQNAKLTEMNQYLAYIFVIVLAFLLYRIVSSALSSMFGGG